MRMTARYPRRAFAADCARGSFGLAVCVGLLGLAQPAPALAWVLGLGAALFLACLARALCRHLTRIEIDESGIGSRGPFGARIPWQGLRSMRLAYYSTRGERDRGWMQLKLRGAGGSIGVDSDLERFVEVARAAAHAARRGAHSFDAATRANLAALGIDEDPPD